MGVRGGMAVFAGGSDSYSRVKAAGLSGIVGSTGSGSSAATLLPISRASPDCSLSALTVEASSIGV